ncbi:DEAD/DEAH box helicase [Leptolyngbya cf. ectocarpi LEGE 11479]|uniref:DEAD/DEAH box helicase n=1 Tax=Leptolyngbya cf. ectocarpi LEGE 11479 TaxID=1828722 RepID=A0A928ZRT5_LEPEC|nr:DEAD/DEAH box helicase [Leptolyngbya ectocarpi]MBE9065097.1 DEAD/DEAH box helicase [Leptolyngbya cf. ectocarpi LEGE 11479]
MVLAPKKLFSFQLDPFQLDAIEALNQGQSVIVCAPTGSGKTLVGEYAIYRALHEKKRVFYTTPLKALSNQKLRDFRNQFGPDNVGLLTGDTSVNRNAPILVMTTEIFRNMLYGTTMGEVDNAVRDVQTVVLDECHYMNDRQRGTVWEESIIYCPPEIQLVGLSATVANGDQLTDWIAKIHGPSQLIYSDFRPVPLTMHFATGKGIFPLLNDKKTALHGRLKKHRKPPRAQRGQKKRPVTASNAFIVTQLQQRDMLPAIFFIFSRKGCDKSVQSINNLSLVNPSEAFVLKRRIDDFLEANPEAARVGQVEPLYHGVAAHHAGLLPAWKGLVEELFQAGLIKVVFATETLAAGINMPARTTVIGSLSKRTDSGHRLLHASEFLQMAGRAGRRGMDVEGHVVTVETPFEGAKEASSLALAKPDPLISQFTPSYGMVLNLLQNHSLTATRDLVERSFGQYLSTLHLSPQQQAIDDVEHNIKLIREQLEAVGDDTIAEYAKLKERLREERRLLKILDKQAMETLASDLSTAINFAVPGTILSLKGKHIQVHNPLPAVIVDKVAGPGQAPYLVCLTYENQWIMAAPRDVFALYEKYGRIDAVDHLSPPAALSVKAGDKFPGDETSTALAKQVPTALPTLDELAPEVKEQRERMYAVETELKTHPLNKFGKPKSFLKKQQRIQLLEEELRDRKAKYQKYASRYWEEFLNLMAILEEFGGLENDRPTNFGKMAAAIRGENELWLALALGSGEFDHLPPHQFAAACAAIVTEITRPDTWTRYRTSKSVIEALEGLRPLRRQMFQQQRRYQVTLPVALEWNLIALVEQWALETEWNELCRNTSLDEGDVVRILRRTLDILAQIAHVPFLPTTLKSTARQAAYLLNRFPINEANNAPNLPDGDTEEGESEDNGNAPETE